MTSIVRELQAQALDPQVKTSDLLRKALVVARKLEVKEFEVWINDELNGYREGREVPAYRKFHGRLRAFNPYHGWIPVQFKDEKTSEKFSKMPCRSAIGELEALIDPSRRDSRDFLSMQLPATFQQKLLEGSGLGEAGYHVSIAAVYGVLDSVKTTILNWALELEKQGIIGNDLSFTAQEKSAAAHTPQNVQYFIGSISGSQIQVGTSQSLQIDKLVEQNSPELHDLIRRLEQIQQQLKLDAEQGTELRSDIETLRAQAASSKPKKSIISESIKSIRTILEGAGGELVADVVKYLIKLSSYS